MVHFFTKRQNVSAPKGPSWPKMAFLGPRNICLLVKKVYHVFNAQEIPPISILIPFIHTTDYCEEVPRSNMQFNTGSTDCSLGHAGSTLGKLASTE